MKHTAHDTAAASASARVVAIQRAALEGAADAAVRSVVAGVLSNLRAALGREPSPRETAQGILDALHGIVSHDPDALEAEAVYPPAAVIGRGKGGAEDLVGVFVAMCIAAGFEATPVWLAQPLHPHDHVFARVKVDGGWFDVETTLRGARLGDGPYEAARRLAGSGSGAEGGPWRRGRSP